MNETVDAIRRQRLCTACGTCAGLCPRGAIQMVRAAADFLVPEVDAERCTRCGLCMKACPGAGLPESLTGPFKDVFTGEALGAWVGRATDPDLWKNGQSGGVVSALLLYLMENGRIDSAVVNGFDAASLRPTVRKARGKADLLAAQGSWYAQSAVNELALGHGGERTAAVVLGCQAEGVMLARQHAKGTVTPDYLIGLVCAGTHSGRIIDDLIEQGGIERGAVSSFRFRDKSAGGWPGNVSIGGDGNTAVLDKGKRIALKDCYGNYRCQCCFDQMNLFADVVVGDPWGLHNGRDRGGRSMALARTRKGLELVEGAIRTGYVEAEPVSAEAVFRGQTVDTRLKPQFFACRSVAQSHGLPFPAYNLGSEPVTAGGRKLRLCRAAMRYRYTVQGLESRERIDRAVRGMKARTHVRSVPQKLAAFLRRALRRLVRLLFKRKGE